MKIEQDLRIAINAAAEASKKNCDRYAHVKRQADALVVFQKDNPRKAKLIKDAVASIQNAKKSIESAERRLESMGVDIDYRGVLSVNCDDKFRNAGGKLAKSVEFTLNEVVSAYVAAKTQAEAEAVLKQFNIIWK